VAMLVLLALSVTSGIMMAVAVKGGGGD